MKTIQIKIDAGDTHCWKCDLYSGLCSGRHYCHALDVPLIWDNVKHDSVRAKECLAAEVKPVGEIK